MRVVAPTGADRVAALRAQLHMGEAQALVLAQEQRVVALVDDLQARNFAKAMGLQILGTAGVLLLAKRRGLGIDVRRALDEMRALGFRLSDNVYDQITRQL